MLFVVWTLKRRGLVWAEVTSILGGHHTYTVCPLQNGRDLKENRMARSVFYPQLIILSDTLRRN